MTYRTDSELDFGHFDMSRNALGDEAGGQVRHEASLARDTISLSITPASSPSAFRDMSKWPKSSLRGRTIAVALLGIATKIAMCLLRT